MLCSSVMSSRWLFRFLVEASCVTLPVKCVTGHLCSWCVNCQWLPRRPPGTVYGNVWVAVCVTTVADWMCSSRLQLNASKMEVLWCASARRSVGCWLWSRVAGQMRARSRYFHWRWPDNAYPSHSKKTCSKCFAALRQLWSIRRSVSNDVMQSLIMAPKRRVLGEFFAVFGCSAHFKSELRRNGWR